MAARDASASCCCNSCAQSELEFPLGYYEGLFLSIDVNKLDADPPEFLRVAGISARKIYDRFCGGPGASTLAGGKPLAAHMKEHRMKRAAALLRETDLSLAEISAQVGYERQSKLTAAFKSQYGVLPSEYRRLEKK